MEAHGQPSPHNASPIREEMQENNPCFSLVQFRSTPQVLRQSRSLTQQVTIHYRGQPFFGISLVFRTLRDRRRRNRLSRSGSTLSARQSWRHHHGDCQYERKRTLAGQQHQCLQLYGHLDVICGTAGPGTNATHCRTKHGIRRPPARRVNLALVTQRESISQIQHAIRLNSSNFIFASVISTITSITYRTCCVSLSVL